MPDLQAVLSPAPTGAPLSATSGFRAPLPDLITAARAIHRIALADTDGDEEAYWRCGAFMETTHRLRANRPSEPDETERSDNANAFWLAKWCAHAFPRIRIRNLRAASLAATAIPGDVVRDILPPWPAFMVTLEDADGLFPDLAHPGYYYDRIEVLHTSVITGNPTWSFWRRTHLAGERFMLATPAEDWGSDLDSRDLFDRAANDPEARIFQAVSRVVLGACMMMSVPGGLEECRRRARSKRFRRGGPPSMTDLVLGNDVRIDVRTAVRDYVAHGGSSPTVQSLVRGHWKYQPHGPKNSLRKLIHVEPYWRGPEDAPVVVRSHVLGQPSV